MKQFLLTMAFLAIVAIASGETLVVPNASFELPSTTFFDFEIADWEDPGNTGVFSNTAGFGNLIVNADGAQLAFMNCDATNIDNNIYIDLPYNLTAGLYTLTVGVAARFDSAPSDPANTKMELRLFTRQPDPVVLASQQVVYSDLSNTELTYYSAILNTNDINPEMLGAGLGIWLDCTEGGAGGDWTLDNVTLTQIPMTAINPNPTDGQSNVGTPVGNDVEVQLSWDTATDPNGLLNEEVTNHYLYLMSGEPNFLEVSPVVISAGDPVSENASYVKVLDMDKTYFWRVDEGINNSLPEDANTIMGPVWSFETLKSVPVINTHPQNQQVVAGETVEFTVEATSLSTMSYMWFVSVDNANDTIEDDIWVGIDSDTLTIISAQPVNEGYYYCIVNNEGGTPVVSKTASLAVSRMVAWYAFDGEDLTDSVDSNDGAPIKAEPNEPFSYTDGIVGKAIVFNGIDEAVLIPRTIQDGFTIAFWVKTTVTGGDGGWWTGRGLVDGEMPGGVNDFGTSLSSSKFAFGVGPGTTILSDSDINDDQWYYCVATRDHVSGQMRVYVNGELEKTVMGPIGRKDSSDSLRIGKIRWGTNYLDGQIDEVKLYNYPLTELEIAKLYNDTTDESVCLRSAQASLDLNDDCKVDMGDFSLLAGQWLDCALVPDCIQ